MSDEMRECTDCEGVGLRTIGGNSFVCLACDGTGEMFALAAKPQVTEGELGKFIFLNIGIFSDAHKAARVLLQQFEIRRK